MLLTWIEQFINWCFSLIPRPKPQKKAVKQALLIAHRGAHHKNRIIENTDAAFKLAQELGCWGIEFDVHTTADNEIVVNHDPTLTRLWKQDASISALTLKQLRKLAPEIPTLTEVVERYGGRMHLFIEIKHPFQGEVALAAALSGLTPTKDYHIISLDADQLKQLSPFPKSSLLLVPVHNNVKQFCELSVKEQYGGVLANYLLLTQARINTIKTADQMNGVGFIDSKYSLYRELNRGIYWIFTNKAEKISHYLQDLR